MHSKIIIASTLLLGAIAAPAPAAGTETKWVDDGKYDNSKYGNYDTGKVGSSHGPYDDGKYHGEKDPKYDNGKYHGRRAASSGGWSDDGSYDNSKYGDYDDGKYGSEHGEYDDGKYHGEHDDKYDDGKYHESGDKYEEPSKTSYDNKYTPSGTASAPKVTHSVSVGLGGLRFEPNNIFAEVGEIIEFRYLPANHSVVQSSFDEPCKPLKGGFFSGFQPTPSGLAPNVFQIEVKDKNVPLWFYCSQTKGDHCQSGMVGSVNQNPDSPKNLGAFTALAAKADKPSISPPNAPLAGNNNGKVIPNPNPNGGF